LKDFYEQQGLCSLGSQFDKPLQKIISLLTRYTYPLTIWKSYVPIKKRQTMGVQPR